MFGRTDKILSRNLYDTYNVRCDDKPTDETSEPPNYGKGIDPNGIELIDSESDAHDNYFDSSVIALSVSSKSFSKEKKLLPYMVLY